jgi:ethanolamine ammonia-lyase small subunit
MSDQLEQTEPWKALSRWTPARIAMGRVGSSLPTNAVLEFDMDHACARDAVHEPFNVAAMQSTLEAAGFHTLLAHSRAHDRAEYLRRPDLGRLLDPACAESLRRDSPVPLQTLTVVVADGLSSFAPAAHALPVLRRLRDGLVDWNLDPIVIATQSRVALGDEIGELRHAEAVIILIGERPGLKSADSLGAYLTYAPRRGRMDSERNCISNIRPGGTSYDLAVFKLLHLLNRARALGATGVTLKDDSDDLIQSPADQPSSQLDPPGHTGSVR